MTLKSDEKFKEKLTCGFKYGMKNLVNFHPTTQKSKRFTSMGYFCPKYIRFGLKKYRGVIVTLKGHAKFKGKLTCGLKINIKNLVNFHVSSWKSKNLHFDQILLSKAYKDLDKKVHKSYVSWHWRVMQSLRKSWLLVPKIPHWWATFVQSIWGLS